MEGLVRRPVVSGVFYSNDSSSLIKEIEWSFLHPLGPNKLPDLQFQEERISLGYVSPHAGYMYSGPIAAHVYYNLSLEKPPDTIILIGTNHTGLGTDVSLAPWRQWETPIGKIDVDVEVRDYIIKNGSIIKPDYLAHIEEHSVEVQVPFIQYVYKDRKKKPRILPIVVMDHRPEKMLAMTRELLEALSHFGRDFTVIASTDLNHYDPHEVTMNKDEKVIRAILDLDEKRLYNIVFREGVSMCGPGGVISLILMAKELTGKRPIVLKHATSGDVSGEKRHTVGYLAALFPR